MSTKLKEMNQNATQFSDVTEQMAILKDDIRSLSATIAEMAQAKGNDMSHSAKAHVAEAREAVHSGVDVAKDQAAQIQGQAQDFIRTQPATALGIAAGVGFLIGMLGTRK
jgi:ElaB/YqjD/DUF883 family membrane-anchored ribosome-binding protein